MPMEAPEAQLDGSKFLGFPCLRTAGANTDRRGERDPVTFFKYMIGCPRISCKLVFKPSVPMRSRTH